MKYFHSFLLLLIIAYGIFESIQAQDQSGSYSVYIYFLHAITALIEPFWNKITLIMNRIHQFSLWAGP